MATRQILLDGAEVLRKRCKEVETVNDHIRLLLDDMMDTLHHTENGAVLAANQVGRAAKTKRPQKVAVQALDENGQSVVVTGEDELAKCLCHELDHLDGIVFLDHAIEEVFFEDE